MATRRPDRVNAGLQAWRVAFPGHVDLPCTERWRQTPSPGAPASRGLPCWGVAVCREPGGPKRCQRVLARWHVSAGQRPAPLAEASLPLPP